jgi:ribonuclease HI
MDGSSWKLNVDASFDPNRGSEATSAIIRDDQGFFGAGRNCMLPFVEDAYTAEACALRDGMSLAGAMGCNRLIVHSDCLEVIEVMKSGGNAYGLAATIFGDCTLFCRELVDVIFEHCPREANMAADR